MTLTAFILSVLGFFCLAFSVPRHCRHLFGRELHRSIMPVLRVAGWLLIVASLAASIERWGALFGTATWFGTITVSAVATTLLLTYGAKTPWFRFPK
jgi:hypothetical protein